MNYVAERTAFEAWWKVAGAQYAKRSYHHQMELRAVAWATWQARAERDSNQPLT